MIRHRSLRFRLTVWYAVILTTALAAFSVMIWLSMRHQLLSDLDSNLNESAARFEAFFRLEAAQETGPNLLTEMEEFSAALPSSAWAELHGPEGLVFRHRTPPPASPRSVQRTFPIGATTYTLQLGSSAAESLRTLNLLGFLLVSLLPLVIAAACAGGWWLSSRALHPVDEITSAARAISIDNLSARLPVPPTGDELQRLTEVWNTTLERLESAVATLSQFAADASHELRTPLAVIRTGAEVALRRARTPESYQDSLTEIAGEAERMTQLVEDLLFIARGDTARSGLAMAPVDLPALLTDVTAELRELAGLRQISFQLHTTTPLTIRANRPALRRLFLVLLDNAVKYSPQGGIVHLTVDGTTVTVEDHGPGIAPEDLPHIFKRFYRADQARSDGGHGLGLSLAQTIAAMHQTTIHVETPKHKGATFAITFS